MGNVQNVRCWTKLVPGIALLILLGSLAGCGSTSRYAGLGAEGDYLRGEELVLKGRYYQAIQTLESFLAEHPGSARVDDAIFYLGLARKGMGEYILARDEFDRLLREFPQSANREEAEWEKAICYFDTRYSSARDPEPTQLSIDAFQIYLRHYPAGVHQGEAEENIRSCRDVLAVKAFENGKTYEKMLRRYKAAVIYYQKSLTILDESSVAARAMAGLVRCYAKQNGKMAEAREWYEALLAYATEERRRADRELDLLVEKTGKIVETLSAGAQK